MRKEARAPHSLSAARETAVAGCRANKPWRLVLRMRLTPRSPRRVELLSTELRAESDGGAASSTWEWKWRGRAVAGSWRTCAGRAGPLRGRDAAHAAMQAESSSMTVELPTDLKPSLTDWLEAH